MSLKKYIATALLLIIGSYLVVEKVQSPIFIFYGGVGTAIIIDLVREFIE